MSEYLKQHPEILFSEPKEPHYFCDDLNVRGAPTSTKEYLELFLHGTGREQSIGEGSVFYLYSTRAVQRIVDFNTDARIIVMLRNPVDAAYAFHSQMIFSHSEDLFDFEEAWRAQERRRKGVGLPKYPLFQGSHQYGPMFSYGHQLKRLFAQVPKDRISVIIYDDFKSDTEGAYGRTLEFLGVGPHQLQSYPVVNSSQLPQSRFLELAYRKAAALKTRIGISKGIGLLSLLRRWNYHEVPRPPLSPEFRAELGGYFRQDILETSELLGRDLSDWLVTTRLSEQPTQGTGHQRGPTAYDHAVRRRTGDAKPGTVST